VIHFDFDDRYQDDALVGGAISRREGVFWSILVHVSFVTLLAFLPTLGLFEPTAEELEEARLEREPPPEDERFVFIEPLNQVPVEQLREQLELSDADRRSQTPETPPEPENPLPFSLGDTSERVIAAAPELPSSADASDALDAEEPDALADAEPVPAEIPRRQPEQQIARNTPPAGPAPQVDATRPRLGVLGEAVRDLSRYTQNQTFNNPQGGGTDPGSTIDFDSKGVDFGPWLRRFVSQVKRNWFVPLSAMSFRGRVVLQFNVHRDGRITDVHVVRPSDIESFTLAAYNAIIGSDPTEPLPPEYPDDMVLFTVTFFYNEQPG
jgi:TonB family protein